MTRLEKTYKWSMSGYRFGLLLFTLIYWNIYIRIIIVLRMLGLREHLSDVSKGIRFMYDEILLSTLVISIFAVISWAAQNFVQPGIRRSFKMRKYAIGIIIVNIVVFFVMGIILGLIHYGIEDQMCFSDIMSQLSKFLFNSTTLFFLIVLFLGGYVYVLMNTFLHQVGYVPLGKMLTGYYQKPREEELIFMFLDLQSSTAVAEILGHRQYSYFVQDCFRNLSKSLLATRGHVYQFVGDEVVVTWNANKKRSYKNAVDFFFLYGRSLERHRAEFVEKYKLFPLFTASINVGKVMAAEVGEIKRELAYHGDVLNTAARIQKQCKHYKKTILITHEFAERLNEHTHPYKVNYVDDTLLAGKKEAVKIYEVSQPSVNNATPGEGHNHIAFHA